VSANLPGGSAFGETVTAFGWAPTATSSNPGACAFALRVSREGHTLSNTCLLENEQHTQILGLTRLSGGDFLLVIGQSTRSFRLVTASTSGEVLSVSDRVTLSDPSEGSTHLVPAEREGGGVWLVGPGRRLVGLSAEGEIVLAEDVPLAEGAGFQALHASSLPGGALLLSGRTWRSNFGEGSLVARLRVDLGTSVEGATPVPGVALQAYPNPSPGATTVRIDVSELTVGTVAVYDVTGRLVRVLRESAPLFGSLTLSWDGLDTAGREAPPGLYLCVVSHGGGRQVTKLVRL
jgi:hypothetical protein